MKTLTGLTVNTLVSRPISAAMQPLRSHCIPIFMLHRMEDPKHGIKGHSVSALKAALKFIQESEYNPISVTYLVNSILTNKPLPPRAVAFTLDDGFYDQAEFALPLFEEYKTPVTVFMITDMMDHNSWSWDFQLDYIITNTTMPIVNVILDSTPFSAELNSTVLKRQFIRKVRQHLKTRSLPTAYQAIQHLSEILQIPISETAPEPYHSIQWSQARKLESEYVQFGAHTCSHSILSQLNGEDAKNEIEQSWYRVKSELSNPCPVFCYPTGRPKLDFGEREKKIITNLGLKAALSSEPGYVESNRDKNDIFALKRFSFPDNLTHFKQYCSWIERAKDKLLYRY